MKKHELILKPIWQLTVEEFLFLLKSEETEATTTIQTESVKKHVYGIRGIAQLFGCSIPTANRIKKSGKSTKQLPKSDEK